MSQPKISPLPVAEGERLAKELGLPPQTGSLLPFRVIANNPALANGIFTQHATLRHAGGLSERHRELLIMRVAWLAESVYEWTQHWTIALSSGVPPEQLVCVRDWRHAACFLPADRAVLQAVDDVFEHDEVLGATWDRCTEALGDPLLTLEVAAAIVHWRGLAVLFRSLDVPLESGAVPWPPDGVAPAEIRGHDAAKQ